MTEVFIVERGRCEDTYVAAIFDDRQAALDYARSLGVASDAEAYRYVLGEPVACDENGYPESLNDMSIGGWHWKYETRTTVFEEA